MTTWAEDQSELAIRHRAEVSALNEEIDRLLAALRVEQEQGRRVAVLEEKVRNLTLALDDALAMVRARNAIRAQEEAAGL
jgi:sirohydrochlorin ferrochelatase